MTIFKTTLFTVFAFSLVISQGCKNNDDDIAIKPIVISKNGNEINLDGQWLSGCVTDNSANLDEVFIFDGNSLVIDIKFYEDVNCNQLVGTEQVTIEFEVLGTLEAFLDGNSVIANKISGMQTLASTGLTDAFKQIFYVNDDNGQLKLYHARFQDDGGMESEDGFPIELIPIAIVAQ